MPSVVGSTACRSAARPISLSARTGLGPRVIFRTRPRAPMNAFCSSIRSAKRSRRLRPSPVNKIRSSHVPATKRRSHASIGFGSGASRMATRGQRITRAPRCSKSCASTSSSRVSGTATVLPANSATTAVKLAAQMGFRGALMDRRAVRHRRLAPPVASSPAAFRLALRKLARKPRSPADGAVDVTVDGLGAYAVLRRSPVPSARRSAGETIPWQGGPRCRRAGRRTLDLRASQLARPGPPVGAVRAIGVDTSVRTTSRWIVER